MPADRLPVVSTLRKIPTLRSLVLSVQMTAGKSTVGFAVFSDENTAQAHSSAAGYGGRCLFPAVICALRTSRPSL